MNSHSRGLSPTELNQKAPTNGSSAKLKIAGLLKSGPSTADELAAVAGIRRPRRNGATHERGPGCKPRAERT